MSWYFDLAPHLNLWNRIRTEKKSEKRKKNKETISKSLSLQFMKQSRMSSFTFINSISSRWFVFNNKPVHGKEG